jgi:hypothetical protein
MKDLSYCEGKPIAVCGAGGIGIRNIVGLGNLFLHEYDSVGVTATL